jgi:hypothetical protein
MITVLLIVLLGLAPPLCSWLALRHRESQWTASLEAARNWQPVSAIAVPATPSASDPEAGYRPGVGYFIGDLSCEFNARSPHLRCAVQPLGPCATCLAYRRDPHFVDPLADSPRWATDSHP